MKYNPTNSPDIALELALYAINSTDLSTARERIKEVDEWVAGGGYVPTNYAYVLDRYNDLEASLDDAFASAI